jgi:hypothetical protein
MSEQPQNVPPGKVPPEILEWARQQFSEEELAAALEEFEKSGGLELKEFVHELEEIVANDG